jgi:hypothetical protein
MNEKEKEVDLVKRFWSEWEAAIDKEEHIQKLSFFDRHFLCQNSKIDEKTERHIQATMINSYLEDLYEYMITKYNVEVKDD